MRCFGASSTNSRRRCRAPRRSPQGGPLTLQFLPFRRGTGNSEKMSRLAKRAESLGVSAADSPRCNTEIVPSVLFVSYHLISAKELEGASRFKLLCCKVYMFNKFLRNARIALVLFYYSSFLFNWVLCEDIHDTVIPQNDV